jgi:hypothetical protein
MSCVTVGIAKEVRDVETNVHSFVWPVRPVQYYVIKDVFPDLSFVTIEGDGREHLIMQ